MKYLNLIILVFMCISTGNATENDDSRGLQWQGPAKNIATPYLQGNYHALIIGNNNYQDNKGVWRQLNTARNDAQTMAAILEQQYGFQHISLLLDASRREILHALKLLSEQVEPNDSVLIYYAGHGHLERNDKRGYWIPVDATGNDNSTFIRNSTIRDEVNIIAERSRHTLVISDSCFSGDLLRTGGRGPSENDIKKGYYQKVASKKSVQILTAGGKEYVDDNYRNSGHSPFSYFLINELTLNNNDMLSLSELATNVKIAVANNVDQTPASGVLHGAGDELGEFIFVQTNIITSINKFSQTKPVQIEQQNKKNKLEVRGTALLNHLGSLFSFGIEYYLQPKTAVLIQYRTFSYTYEEDAYTENGSGTMFGLTYRSYDNFNRNGYFYGAGVDFVSGNWDSREYDSGSYINEEGKISGTVPHAVIGYKNAFGNMFYEFNGYAGLVIGDASNPLIFGVGLSITKPF